MTTVDRAALASYTAGVLRARAEYTAHPHVHQFDPERSERPLHDCAHCPRRTRSVTGICQRCRTERTPQ